MLFLSQLLELDVKLTRCPPPTGGDIMAASRSRDYVIVTSDKWGGQSVWRHGERSTDKSGFADGGHNGGMLWEHRTQVLAAWQTAPDGVGDCGGGHGRASCSGGTSSAAEAEDWDSQTQIWIQADKHGGSRNVGGENRKLTTRLFGLLTLILPVWRGQRLVEPVGSSGEALKKSMK